MDSKPPLSYLCSQAILNYMDFSLRSILSKRSSAFLPLNRLATVRIQRLSLEKKRIEIDNTIYRVSVVRIRKDGETSEYAKLMNSKGGWEDDLDEYGFAKNEVASCTTIEWRETNFVEAEKTLKKKLSAADPKYAEILKKKFLKDQKDNRDQIEAFKLRAKKLPPAYNQYIRLTVISRNFKILEHVEYSHQLHEAMEYLVPKIFGLSVLKNKKVIVGDLTVEKEAAAYLSDISSKINFEEHPLKEITTTGINYQNFQMIRSAALHIIREINLRNCSDACRIHFKLDTFHSRELYALIEDLKIKDTPLGKHISIENKEIIYVKLSSIPNSARSSFPENEYHILCSTVKHSNPEKEINCYHKRKPNRTELHIKIHKRGFATGY